MIYSAHWDHFGTRAPHPTDKPDTDRIYNGAYDNASGVARRARDCQGLREGAAEAARSIYFAFVTAEESGLLGSAFLVANPPIPMDKVAANINIDGVNYLGPTGDMVQLGSDRSTLGPMVEAILRNVAERSAAISIRSAATSSAPIISRSRKPACRRCR